MSPLRMSFAGRGMDGWSIIAKATLCFLGRSSNSGTNPVLVPDFDA